MKFSKLMIFFTVAVFSMGLFTSCGKSKKKMRKEFKKYKKATRTLLDSASSIFMLAKSTAKNFDKSKKDKAKKDLNKKLKDYKNVITKFEAVAAPNKKIKEIKKVDIAILKTRRDMIKLWKNNIKDGKSPSFGSDYKELKAKYKNLSKEGDRLRKEYKRSTKKKHKKYKKYKKKRKHKW